MAHLLRSVGSLSKGAGSSFLNMIFLPNVTYTLRCTHTLCPPLTAFPPAVVVAHSKCVNVTSVHVHAALQAMDVSGAGATSRAQQVALQCRAFARRYALQLTDPKATAEVATALAAAPTSMRAALQEVLHADFAAHEY